MSGWRLDWPAAWGGPAGSGRIKVVPEDFFVEEVAGQPLDGQGEHLYLFLEKTGDNTRYVAGEIARLAGCRPMDVSFSGLKDRNAVTRQWFSIYRPGQSDEQLLASVASRWRLLDHGRHGRKLRRGDHRANRFRLRLQQLVADRKDLMERLARVSRDGCPNYFGAQRFGHDSANLDAAAALDPGRLRGRSFKRGIYLSAARSWLFNEYLASRVEAGDWRERLTGDPGTGEPTGPLYGDGGSDAGEPLRSRENAVIEAYPVFRRLLDSARVRPERRMLILLPVDMEWELSGDTLELNFELPTGAYATSVLAEILRQESCSGDARKPLE